MAVKKSASVMVLLLLILSVLVTFSPVSSVKAQNMTYIRVDGSVDPSTEFIQRTGDVYTVIGDFDDLVVVEKNNTVFDGADHM